MIAMLGMREMPETLATRAIPETPATSATTAMPATRATCGTRTNGVVRAITSRAAPVAGGVGSAWATVHDRPGPPTDPGTSLDAISLKVDPVRRARRTPMTGRVAPWADPR